MDRSVVRQDSADAAPGNSRRVSGLLESAADSIKNRAFSLSGYAARLAVVFIILMGGLTVVDILLRAVFNRPVPEVMEISQFLLAMTVFLGIGYTATKNGHVRVDILSVKFSPKLNVFIGSLGGAASICLFIVMGWQQIEKALTSIKTQEVAPVTQFPYYPILFLITLGCALLAVVILAEFLHWQAEMFRTFRRPWLGTASVLVISSVFLLLPALLPLFSVKMSTFTAGLWGVALLMVFIFAGLPIGFVMGLIGLLGT